MAASHDRRAWPFFSEEVRDYALNHKRRHPPFTMIAHRSAPGCRLRLVGELDLATAPTLRQTLDHLRDSGHRYLALDLSELAFLGAAGLDVFAQADRQFRDAGGWLILTHPTDHIRDLLQITELHTVLTVHPHRDGQTANRHRA